MDSLVEAIDCALSQSVQDGASLDNMTGTVDTSWYKYGSSCSTGVVMLLKATLENSTSAYSEDRTRLFGLTSRIGPVLQYFD